MAQAYCRKRAGHPVLRISRVRGRDDGQENSRVETDWRNVFQQAQTCDVPKSWVARVAGSSMVRVPTGSISTVMAKGWSVSAKGARIC